MTDNASPSQNPPSPAAVADTQATAAPASQAAPAVASPAGDATPVADPGASPAAASVTVNPAPASLLGAEPPKEAVKTETEQAPEAKAEGEKQPEAKVEGDKKPETVEQPKEGAQSGEPAPLPTYEAFTLPEGVSLDNEKLAAFTKDLGEFQLESKADQAAIQKFGQKLIDRYVAETQETMTRLNEHLVNNWEKQKSEWKETFLKDPELGGNRTDTTIKAIVNAIETHGGSAEQKAEFRKLMNDTGLGNHPAQIRTLNNLVGEINRLKAKYESEGSVKMLPGQKPEGQAKSKIEKRYGSNT